MKKIFIAIFAFIYLGVSSGIALNVHYCMNKISSVDLFHHSNKCSRCGMKTDPSDRKGNTGSGCCKTELKIIKLTDNQKITFNHVNLSAPEFSVNNEYRNSNSNIPSAQVILSLDNISPPAPPGISRCIFNCVFRI